MHTDSTRPSPGALPPRPCDASWSLPRLLHCGRLGAASQAATGTAATPQLPLKLLLLLLGCYCEWPKRRRKTKTELPLLPAPAPEPPLPPPPGLPSPSLLLLRHCYATAAVEPPAEACEEAKQEGEKRRYKRPKDA